eukprot:IDg13556t1
MKLLYKVSTRSCLANENKLHAEKMTCFFCTYLTLLIAEARAISLSRIKSLHSTMMFTGPSIPRIATIERYLYRNISSGATLQIDLVCMLFRSGDRCNSR